MGDVVPGKASDGASPDLRLGLVLVFVLSGLAGAVVGHVAIAAASWLALPRLTPP